MWVLLLALVFLWVFLIQEMLVEFGVSNFSFRNYEVPV
jgi:hypothetical protein